MRVEVQVREHGYAPHRHDTYTFALTLEGVQCFNYRETRQHSLPGGVVVLHPDELHDGFAGTDDGFLYRAISLDPALIQSALGGKPLPFIHNGISTDARLLRALRPLLDDYKHSLDAMQFQDAVYGLATTLRDMTCPARPHKRPDIVAAERARQYLIAHWNAAVSMEDLEHETGRNRWKLSRDFRTLYGTSPYRYLTMRRLERARVLIQQGHAPAGVAVTCRFADQSHLIRQFRKAFGVTPSHWAASFRAGPGCTIVL
ncbi:MAG: AraC family transcriptional regulator [Gammaproteobacteria bacterium]|nr:AraC family transcriptional regulator [Gammaproteobacteria bacterium]